MRIQRMEPVGTVVDDPAAATAFFVELGLKLEGEFLSTRGTGSAFSIIGDLKTSGGS